MDRFVAFRRWRLLLAALATVACTECAAGPGAISSRDIDAGVAFDALVVAPSPGLDASSRAEVSVAGDTDALLGSAPMPDSPVGAASDSSSVTPTEIDASSDGSAPGTSVLGGLPCQAELCEGFEGVALGSPPNPALWTSAPKIIVDGLHPALGTKQSMHLPAVGAGGGFATEMTKIPGGGKTFYGRFFFWFDRLPLEKPGSLYHWTMVSPKGGGMDLRIGGHVERDGLNWVRFNPGGMGGETGLSDLTAVMDAKQWYCMEFFFDTPNNESRIWLNGQERPVLHWKDSVPGWQFPPGGITSISFGFVEYQGAATPFELFIDEIALDSKRIGCAAPLPPPPSDPSTLKPPAAGQGNGVACGGAMCAAGQKCGTDQTHGSFQPKCVASNAAYPAASALISCDGPEDCPGQACCIESLSQISGCQASCAGGTFAQLCHTQGDCAAGQMCCPTKVPPQTGIRYSVCQVGPC